MNQSTTFSRISFHYPPRLAHVVAFEAISVVDAAFVVGVVVFIVFRDLYRLIGLLK